MFPQFKKLNNESGIVLFIVLMTSIVIMIYSAGILTQSVNEINYAQQQIDQITSDQLSKGVFWNSYASGMTALPAGAVAASPGTGSGRTYQVSVIGPALPTIPNGSNNYTVSTTFDIVADNQ